MLPSSSDGGPNACSNKNLGSRRLFWHYARALHKKHTIYITKRRKYFGAASSGEVVESSPGLRQILQRSSKEASHNNSPDHRADHAEAHCHGAIGFRFFGEPGEPCESSCGLRLITFAFASLRLHCASSLLPPLGLELPAEVASPCCTASNSAISKLCC